MHIIWTHFIFDFNQIEVIVFHTEYDEFSGRLILISHQSPFKIEMFNATIDIEHRYHILPCIIRHQKCFGHSKSIPSDLVKSVWKNVSFENYVPSLYPIEHIHLLIAFGYTCSYESRCVSTCIKSILFIAFWFLGQCDCRWLLNIIVYIQCIMTTCDMHRIIILFGICLSLFGVSATHQHRNLRSPLRKWVWLDEVNQ